MSLFKFTCLGDPARPPLSDKWDGWVASIVIWQSNKSIANSDALCLENTDIEFATFCNKLFKICSYISCQNFAVFTGYNVASVAASNATT